MEKSDPSIVAPQPQLPTGFRFHPTDEELVVHYLKKKAAAAPLPVAIIADIDLYKFDPWELPAKAVFGEQEWYFFSPRDRKYPNGARPNRAANSGYWKATGTDKPVLSGGGTVKVGVKKALVFYGGKPPKGIKTNWIMHEYRLDDNNNHNNPYKNPDFGTRKRLDDWVLCRIYKKNSNKVKAVDHKIDHDMKRKVGVIPRAHHKFVEYNQGLYELGMMSCQEQNMLSMKRSLPFIYWNNDGAGNVENSAKTCLVDDQNCIASSTDETTTLDYCPAAILGPQAMARNLGEGVFGQQHYQIPHMNWYS